MDSLTCNGCGQLNPSDAPACAYCGLTLNEENIRRSAPRVAPEFAPREGAHPFESGFAPREGAADAQSPPPFDAGAESLPSDFHVSPFVTVGDVLLPTLRVYRDNFPLIAKIVLLFAVPFVVLQTFLLRLTLPEGGPWLLEMLMNLVGHSLLAGALIYAVVRFLRSGVNPTVAESYRWGLKKWLTVFGCTLVFNIVTSIGYLLLLIPGVILSLKYALVIPVAAIEDIGVSDAFKRSDALTSGYRWQIFLTQFVLGLLIILISVVAVYSSTDVGGVAQSFIWLFVYGVTMQLLQSTSFVLSLFIYLGILANSDTISPNPLSIAPPPHDFTERLLP